MCTSADSRVVSWRGSLPSPRASHNCGEPVRFETNAIDDPSFEYCGSSSMNDDSISGDPPGAVCPDPRYRC